MRADNMTTRAGRAGRKQDVMRRRSDEMRVLNTRNRRRALHILSYSKWINEMRRIIILDMLVCDSQARFVCLHSGTPGVYASDGAGMSDWRQPKGQERFFVLLAVWTWGFAVCSERAGLCGWQEKPADSSQMKPLCRFLLLFLPLSHPEVREKPKSEDYKKVFQDGESVGVAWKTKAIHCFSDCPDTSQICILSSWAHSQ